MSEFRIDCECCDDGFSENLTKLFKHRRTYNSSNSPNSSKNNNIRKLCFYCPLHFECVIFHDGFSTLQKEKPGLQLACDFCQTNFLTQTNFHHECYLCNISSISTCKQLFNHLKHIHKSKKPFQCLVCRLTYTKIANLKRHILNHTASIYKCKLCPKKFSTEKILKEHKCKILKTAMPIHTITNDGNFTCKICNKKFHTPHTRRLHIMAMHSNVIYCCPICPKLFSTQSGLNAHHVRDHTIMKFKCNQCPKEYALEIDLHHHKCKHHTLEPIERQRFKCDQCPKAFERKSDLWNHNSKYHKSRIRFKCDQCPKTYFRKYDLECHKNIHLGKKPYSCDICGKTFIKADHVKSHQYSHSEEKQFQCSICKKKLSTPGAVVRHLKTVHSKQKS